MAAQKFLKLLKSGLSAAADRRNLPMWCDDAVNRRSAAFVYARIQCAYGAGKVHFASGMASALAA